METESALAIMLDDYAIMLLDLERDSDSADQFRVSLRARAGSNLRLFSSTKYAESRDRATAIANLIRFDIDDRSPTIRSGSPLSACSCSACPR